MADEFDRFLAAALAPEERTPDRRFVARVQSAILLEERLAAQRSSVVRDLVRQLVALAAVAAALWWLGRAAPVASWFGESPALGLGILLTGFACLVGLFSLRSGSGNAPFHAL
jgi:hypothetical protein